MFSVSESLEHPYESIKIFNNKKWQYVLNKSKKYYRRQDFDFKSYFINGAIYILHKELVVRKKIYHHEMQNPKVEPLPSGKALGRAKISRKTSYL